MKMSRRGFIKGSLVFGGSLLIAGPRAGVAKQRIPLYTRLDETGGLDERVSAAYDMFKSCTLCPRQCGVDRTAEDLGFCKAPAKLKVYSSQPHFGEEKSLVGQHGSGTIFFSNCNLRCVFCQNWPIAHKGHGKFVSDDALAVMMLQLQAIGCHNINLVTPTHVMPNILNGVKIASRKGLRIPLVYNTSGYERTETLALLDGIVDIYLPDMKFMNPEQAETYSGGAANYPEVAQKALIEMHRQVGLHATDAQGVAVSGLMIRHLVMPNRVAGTKQFIDWLSANLPRSTYVNIMAQYHVAYKAFDYPDIWRRITVKEYLEAMNWAEKAGLTNLDPDSLRMRDFYKRHEE